MPSWIRIRIRNLYADPDPAAQINADPCGSGSETLYFPPVEILSSDTVTNKDCVQREKYDLISLLQYFPPSTQSVRVEQLLHGLRGKKNKDTEKKYHIFSPSWIFVHFLA